MTNAEIIERARFALMKEGKLKGTGEFATFTDDAGNEFEIEIPEEMHTFAFWKENGYMVKKGEHAVAKLTIWKHTVKEHEAPEGADENTKAILSEPSTKMFMKTAAFFAASQVSPIEA